jgi:ethanolamine ammonia-lyase small subunit
MTEADERWRALKALTPARIGLGRAGAGLPTRAALDFALAHARARDAVHAALDTGRLADDLMALGLTSVQTESRAPSRAVYLARPDLGRVLTDESRQALSAARGGNDAPDLALVLADGLSAIAVQTHAAPFLGAFLPRVRAAGWRLAPVVIARQARVALGDDIGAALDARAVAVLIGERPGLSSPDSLGIYLTIAPRPGRQDAERNCISNIRPGGLSYGAAAFKSSWLLGEALRLGVSGVALKDLSDNALASSAASALSPPDAVRPDPNPG